MFRFFATVLALTLELAATSSSRANDTAAETALGGLALKQSDSISMDSEDLYVSPERVRVKYRFTNITDEVVETVVAFPLPDIPPYSEENKTYWANPADLKFRTTIDGKPVSFDIVQQAIFKGKDVTARLQTLKVRLNYRDPAFEAALNEAPQAERKKLITEGLLKDEGVGGQHSYEPQWSLRTIVTRRQTFPPKTTVSVEHEYAPLAGGSLAGYLSASQRKTSEFKGKQRKYCIERDWLASFDRRAGKTEAGDAYGEIWLGYVLTTGANWKGPIGEFRLVVDKGNADRLVSFCADGVKKISDTQFEVRQKNFTPRKDLEILIVEWLRSADK
ncbi:DUF4424 family protein [Methylocystis sp. IM3]|uniref:DUF4424 family protein n=1 Tax=unclassified Methylocystis TaxID=2625913 RepID=UPI0030FC8EC1